MEYKGETARCCGGGGGVRAGFPDVSKDLAGKRVSQADFADLLLSTCPFCLNNLNQGKEFVGSNTEIRDLTEVIDELLE
jgi:Fe-S oxidoreductase